MCKRVNKIELICKKCNTSFNSYSPRHLYCEECKICKCGCGKQLRDPKYNYLKGHIKKYNSKKLKYICVCKFCNIIFKAADYKAVCCKKCKQPKICKCGCGGIVTSPGRYYMRGHKLRGKTYKEIYGDVKPKCGFKTGADNPMGNIQLLEKCLNNVQYKRSKYNGINFRSSWEVEIYKILERKYKNDIVYESSIRHPNGWLKPDFIVENTIIEVSGYASAYRNSRVRNIKKLKLYLEHTNKEIIFIVDKNFLFDYNQEFSTCKRIKLITYQDRYQLLDLL